MAGVALVGYVLAVVLAVVIVWIVARRRPQGDETVPPPVRALLSAARRRATLAVIAAAVAIVAAFVASYSLPALLGLPFLLSPAVGATAGLLLYAAIPPRAAVVEADRVRDASLTPRTPVSYLPRAGAILLAILVVAQTAFVLFTGFTSSPDDSGRYRAIAFQVGDVGSVSTPYAGWFYGIPLLVATAILTAATFVALWRVSSTPALPDSDLAEVDAGWRRATNRIIVAISAAAVLLQFGGVAVQSGLTLRNAAYNSGLLVWSNTGVFFGWAGVLMLIGSVVGLTLALLWALTLPDLAVDRTSPHRVEAVAP
ncbi:hypothetical protein [Microbacterium ulmi]|uniref:Uncharacterized protein n=1 Tax=Microbacterium ulmi TaxID=179095 RepID=A0A7Y2Q0I8_9MICO|nr:hypothetical protein [Microbacterium ulmi]NII70908.1 hypothetical protein [Microbacterium ulmi]NNH02920.1 hypothetical protein [Microbacterium ulmi]